MAKALKLNVMAVVAGIILAGCVGPQTRDPALAALPILEPTGRATSHELVRLFASGCVSGFPDQEAMAATFLKEGFAEDAYVPGFSTPGERTFYRASDELSAYVGISASTVPTFPFGDKLTFSYGCSIGGDVSDQANFEAEMLAVTDQDGRPVSWENRGSGYRTVQDRAGVTATLTALPPVLLRSTICDGLPACRYWSNTGMGMSVQVERPSP